jgi:ribonucleotide reductase alpha subunit
MAILSAQMETGVPYILFKDACNRKSNQKNLGTIKSSNLCTEIIEYSSKDETAVCNLASICLPTFVKEEDKTFDYKKLYNVVKVITRNLNNVIDITYYPTSTSIRSNMRHRPIGLGVQGLADAYLLMDLAYTSNEAKEMNKLIFETIYYASLETSYEISKERYDVIYNDVIQQFGEFTKETLNKVVVKSGRCWDDDEIWETRSNTKPISKYDLYWNESRQGLNNPKWIGAYSSFDGSPTSKGVLQFDMWDNYTPVSNRYDWTSLKNNIQEYGIRNSLLVAPMPTVSTSQIMGFNESFEPYSSNMYTKNTLTGNYIITNQHLIKELIQMGQWNEKMKNNIIANNGSVAQLTHLPETFREKYRTVWEISMEDMINMSADRAPFICHSQSLNYYVEEPNVAQLTRLFMLAYTRGLKTGMYYLRRKAKHQAQQFTVEPINENDGEESETQVCEMCSA